MAHLINPLLSPPSKAVIPPLSNPNAATPPISQPIDRVDTALVPAVSTIVPPLTQTRPRLTPPATLLPTSSDTKQAADLSELKFIAAMTSFRQFGEDLISCIAGRLEAFKLKMQEISLEAAERLKEAAERAKESGFWSLLKKIATCLLSVLSIVLGFSLISSGAGVFVGGAMIASGLLSVANLTFSEAGIWEWVAKKLAGEDEEKRKQLAMLLPTAIGIASGLIGVFGATGAAILTGVNLLDKAIFIAQAGLALFQGATTIGQGYANAQLLWAQADLSETRAEINVGKQLIDMLTSWLDDFIKQLGAARKKTSQYLNLATQSNQIVVKDLHS